MCSHMYTVLKFSHKYERLDVLQDVTTVECKDGDIHFSFHFRSYLQIITMMQKSIG